jgi:glutamate-1-semialdehyde 2,1-aminomutase
MSDTVSADLLERAQALIPGGVNSPVRAFNAVGGHPVFIEHAEGARVFGADGSEYIDYVGSWGPAILGHAHPAVIEAVQKAAARGLTFGAPTAQEVDFAEAIRARHPSVEMMRCVSSGTEATMSALRAARGFTGRAKIVKFAGGYHGHADCLLVKAGSGAATLGTPDSAGVPPGMVADTLTLRYNDVAALNAMFADQGDEIAAVIVEPVAGNMGCIPPAPGFLEAIISLCKDHGAVSVFDEVMTGCRVGPGSAQGRFGLTPDMTCLGKVVGGGMPLAVYGGRASIMKQIAPLGPVYQAGTLSGNPVAVAAGLTTLGLLTDDVYERLEGLGARLEAGLNAAIAETGVTACVQRVGAMITLFFHPGPVKSWTESSESDTAAFATWFGGLLERGVYWPPSAYEAAFLSAAHTDDDIDRTIAAARESLAAMS